MAHAVLESVLPCHKGICCLCLGLGLLLGNWFLPYDLGLFVGSLSGFIFFTNVWYSTVNQYWQDEVFRVSKPWETQRSISAGPLLHSVGRNWHDGTTCMYNTDHKGSNCQINVLRFEIKPLPHLLRSVMRNVFQRGTNPVKSLKHRTIENAIVS